MNNQKQVTPCKEHSPIAFIYDIPRNEGLTNKDLKEALLFLGVACQVQICQEKNRPFLSARLKISEGQNIEEALDAARYFHVKGKCCRVMGFEPLLQRNPNFDLKKCPADLPKRELPVDANYQQILREGESFIMPDNCYLECNLFVKGIDRSFDSSDLFRYFCQYGPIKSAKLSLVPETHESRGYGFVWFAREGCAQAAMNDSREKKIPFVCALYKPRTLASGYEGNMNCVVVKRLPESFEKEQMRELFVGFGQIDYCEFINKPLNARDRIGMVTFRDPQQAMFAVEMNQMDVEGQKIIVELAIPERLIQDLKSILSKEQNSQNMEVLFVKKIPKEVDGTTLRKALAAFGIILGFKHLIREDYTHSVAFVLYRDPAHAEALLQQGFLQINNHQVAVSRAPRKGVFPNSKDTPTPMKQFKSGEEVDSFVRAMIPECLLRSDQKIQKDEATQMAQKAQIGRMQGVKIGVEDEDEEGYIKTSVRDGVKVDPKIVEEEKESRSRPQGKENMPQMKEKKKVTFENTLQNREEAPLKIKEASNKVRTPLAELNPHQTSTKPKPQIKVMEMTSAEFERRSKAVKIHEDRLLEIFNDLSLSFAGEEEEMVMQKLRDYCQRFVQRMEESEKEYYHVVLFQHHMEQVIQRKEREELKAILLKNQNLLLLCKEEFQKVKEEIVFNLEDFDPDTCTFKGKGMT